MSAFHDWLRGLYCGRKKQDSGPPLPRAHTLAIGPERFAEDNNSFAVAMYGRLRQRSRNLLFSPFSIRMALGMAYAGARGETAAQMSRTLHLPSSDETLHLAFAEIIQRLTTAGGGIYEMAVASSLWSQDGAPRLAAFLDLIARYYGDAARLVDFRRAPDAARVTINQWVEDRTKQKIRELIPSSGVTDDTRLILVNAVYFMGKWSLQFRPEATCDEPFHLEGGGKVQGPLMYICAEIPYLQVKSYQAVDLNYLGGDLSMLVLLPGRKNGLQNLESTLSAKMLHECVARMGVRLIKLFLPRFKITWSTVNIRDQLEALGMSLPFNRDEADFSGISGYKAPDENSLVLRAVYHKAFVEVNEEGTEAAAATAATKGTGAFERYVPQQVPIFRADHPFMFAIRDRKNGAILFLGRIADPTRES